MLLFIFLVATLNLGVGYALGKGLDPHELFDRALALMPKRAVKQPVDADIEDEPLSRPAPPVAEEPPAKKPETAKRNPQEVLASLASFRNELNSASVELKNDRADPEKFEASATKLQEASHAYVEGTGDAIKELEELGAAGDVVATATHEAVAEGAGRVAEISGEIDGMLADGLEDEEARNGLVKLSDRANLIATEIEGSAKAVAERNSRPAEAPAQAETEKPQIAPTSHPTLIASIDELFDRLETALASEEGEATQHVAAVRIDPVAGHEDDDAVTEAVESKIAKAAAELLTETQAFVAGRPAMILLKGDSFDEAKERLENLRQRVEKATLSVAGENVKATITCAFADARPGDPRDQIIDQLNLALEESTRFGNNRTYHHDGAFPTPVDERDEAASAEPALAGAAG